MLSFGKKIKELRTSRRFSQQYLSSAMNLPQTTISALERNAIKPDFDTVEKFAKFYGVSPYTLLPFETETTDSKMYEVSDSISRNQKLRALFDCVKSLSDPQLDAIIAVARTMSGGEG